MSIHESSVFCCVLPGGAAQESCAFLIPFSAVPLEAGEPGSAHVDAIAEAVFDLGRSTTDPQVAEVSPQLPSAASVPPVSCYQLATLAGIRMSLVFL